jgi:hypothetical protein
MQANRCRPREADQPPPVMAEMQTGPGINFSFLRRPSRSLRLQ